MPNQHAREWIVLADAAHVKIYAREQGNGAMTPLHEFEHPESRLRQRDFSSDNPGQGHSSGTHRSTSYVDHANFPEQERLKFLREVAEEINAAAEKDAMDKLILVALPKTLTAMKSALNDKAAHRIAEEYNKNLVNAPVPTLGEHLHKLKVEARGF